MTNRLLQHGQRIVQCVDLNYIAPANQSSIIGVVAAYDRADSASDCPTSLNLISKKYRAAIEFTLIPDKMRGVVLLFGLIALIPLIHSLEGILDDFTGQDLFLSSVSATLAYIIALGAALTVLWATRFEMFRPTDEPIIFDRKHKKIYRRFRDVPPGLASLFKPWSVQTAEYDWDLTDAFHTARLVAAGSNVSRHHHLRFAVRKSSTDSTIIDSFSVGNTLLLNERTVSKLWEHIRRFMEENGPHLQPRDELNRPTQSRSLWTSMGAVGPFGANFTTWWRRHPVFTSGAIILSPVYLPMNLAWGICHWLSCVTAYSVEWPDEVQNAIGPESTHEPVEV